MAKRANSHTTKPAKQPTISFIVPTISRPTLSALMERLIEDMGPGDQVILVGDGRQHGSRGWPEKDPRILYFEFPGGRHGNPGRDFALTHATGDFIMYIDDDDNLIPGAINHVIRPAIATAPERPHVFRCQGIPVQPPPFAETTPGASFVWPNDPARLGQWDDGTSHNELFFLKWSLAHFPEPVLHDIEVYIIRPHTNPGRYYMHDGRVTYNAVEALS